MHVNGTAKQADDRISIPGISQAVRGNSDLPARAWGAASTPANVLVMAVGIGCALFPVNGRLRLHTRGQRGVRLFLGGGRPHGTTEAQQATHGSSPERRHADHISIDVKKGTLSG